MQIYRGFESYPADAPRAAALGVFDGVHRGHRKVLNTLLETARARRARSSVITFESHPKSVVGGRAPLCITSTRHKLRLIESLGVDECLLLRFDESLAEMEAREFALKAFRGASAVIVGFDQRFGKNRRGDAELLREIGREAGFEVRIVEPELVRGRPVSSTAVREAVLSGDLDLAAEMLGRRLSVLGKVVHGAGRGKRLGFPTANLDLQGELYPPDGVYLTETILDGVSYPSVTNIGRPNSSGDESEHGGESVVEPHMLDFSGDIYGEDLEVVFLEKMRDERMCRGDEELIRLITSDVVRAREFFAERFNEG